MIKIKNLSKTFGAITALQNTTLELGPGYVYGLVGPNGCGKTTLIKSILGLVIPDSGQVTVKEVDCAKNWEYRSNIGYLPQNPDFPANMTLRELLDLLSETRQQIPLRKDELLKIFALEKVLDRPFGELSGGMKQRVGAVCAMCFDSPILIFDEPTVGLDPLILVPFKKLIREEARRGKLVILVSHVLVEMEQLADRFLFMLDGQISLQGDLKAVLAEVQSQSLEEAVVRWMERV
jgi:Cu-processing system ATP-binding protein